MKKIVLLMLLSCLICSNSFAWDGYDWDNHNYVDIEQGSLVRPGEEIEIYDWGNGGYKDVEVEDVNSYGGITEVEIYDRRSGEYRTFEMEDY